MRNYRNYKRTLLTCGFAALLGAMPLSGATGSSPSTKDTEPKRDLPAQKGLDDRFFDEMRDIQDRMESLFSRAWTETRHDLKNLTPGVGFSSSAKLTEENDSYVARFNLPQRDIQKADVTVDANNTLHVVAKDERDAVADTTKAGKDKGTAETRVLSRYEQAIALPGPVDSSKMKVDRSGDTLTVTLPKLHSSGVGESTQH